MAPELLAGTESVANLSCDVYSFGMTSLVSHDSLDSAKTPFIISTCISGSRERSAAFRKHRERCSYPDYRLRL